MNNLAEMSARMNQWMNEKPSFDGGRSLRFQKNDVIFFQFVASGQDGDQFIKVYRSHIIDIIRNGQPSSVQKYCPIQSGEGGVECPYCNQGHTNIKERMSIWMYVMEILHETMPEGKSLQQVPFENRTYFREEVNDFKLWETSAWKESIWVDILKSDQIYKGLHNFTAQLLVTGEQLGRRFKLYAMPNTATVTAEIYEAAKTNCEPIPSTLKAQMASPVMLNPAASQAVANQTQPNTAPAAIAAWTPPGAAPVPTKAWSPPGAIAAPTSAYTPPGTVTAPPPAAVVTAPPPPPTPAPTVPTPTADLVVAEANTVVVEQPEAFDEVLPPPPAPPASQDPAVPVVNEEAPAEEPAARRPLRKLI